MKVISVIALLECSVALFYKPEHATLEEAQRLSYLLLHSGVPDPGGGCSVRGN